MPYYFPEVNRRVEYGGGINSIADFFVEAINEGERKDKVKQFKKGVDLVSQYDKASKQYSDYLATLGNIQNAPVGEIPQGGVEPRAPIMPEKIEDTSGDFLNKIYKTAGALDTKGDQGKQLSEDLMLMLGQTQKANEENFFVNNTHQISTKTPGKSIRIPETKDKAKYQEYATSAPYQNDKNEWEQIVYFRNLSDKNDEYTRIIKSQDPLLQEKFGVLNRQNSRTGSNGSMKGPELSQDELIVDQQSADAVILANESQKLKTQLLHENDPEKQAELRRKIQENEAAETNLGNQLSGFTGVNSKYIQYKKTQQGFTPKAILEFGNTFKDFQSQVWNQENGTTVGQMLQMLKTGNLSPTMVLAYTEQIKNLIKNYDTTEEMKVELYNYLTDINSGGVLWEVDQQRNPESIKEDVESVKKKYSNENPYGKSQK